MSITATTTLGAVMTLLRTRVSAVLTGDPAQATPIERVAVVDKLRLQDSGLPCIQIEPVSLQSIAEYTSMNVMSFEYRVHAVVKVELDMGKRSEKRMVGGLAYGDPYPRGAFTLAVAVCDRLIGYKPNTGTSPQVFQRLDSGQHDDVEGLASASASFRMMIRLMVDG